MVKIKNIRLEFLLLVPIIILFAAGVFLKSTDKVLPQTGCVATDLSGMPSSELTAMYNGQQIFAPAISLAYAPNEHVLGVANPDERWIEVDLSDQKVRAWDGDQIFLESLVSSGLPATPTPTGEFRVWMKLRATKMEGGSGRGYYYLPNVPFVMYFQNSQVPGWKGYSLHGTYWHNDFGSQRSHGCVNLPTPVAEKLFEWASPTVQNGTYSAYSSADNQGIRIIIHE